MNNLFTSVPMYQQREDLESVAIDMTFCRFAYGFQPEEYLCFDLENKSMNERQEFIEKLLGDQK